jgi:translation initiation factor 2 alpha subunit (eIF-2alpha)
VERAVIEMAREYILHQTENYRSVIESLQAKYGMTYDQFNAYLKARSETLVKTPNPALNQAVMKEEDASEWKIAEEMLQAWLGLQSEVGH